MTRPGRSDDRVIDRDEACVDIELVTAPSLDLVLALEPLEAR